MSKETNTPTDTITLSNGDSLPCAPGLSLQMKKYIADWHADAEKRASAIKTRRSEKKKVSMDSIGALCDFDKLKIG